MLKRNTIMKTLLLTFLLLVICSPCFMLIACNDEPTVYKLYRYGTGDEVYDIGDDFYGMEMKKDFVKLTLDKDGKAELKINLGFVEGSEYLQDEYHTCKGTYTETETEIKAVFPELNIPVLTGEKIGKTLIVSLGDDETLILKK